MDAERIFMTGKEKLDLLAENLTSQRSRNTSLIAPFDLGKCIRIAESQYNARLDDIANLKDPGIFYDKITSELSIERMRLGSRSQSEFTLPKKPFRIASVVSTKVHNVYMMASAWRLVINIFRDLQASGLNSATALARLETDVHLHSQYLVLCGIVDTLVDLAQAHFSILVMTSPHYSAYFKEVENTGPGEPFMVFDLSGTNLRGASRSFLDTVIIELCFPVATYSRQILFQILHNAVEISPREAKRFLQLTWDAIGDLSVSLELQDYLGRLTLGPQGEKLRARPIPDSEQYEEWLDAQIYSRKASELYDRLVDVTNPLERTKDQSVLDTMWELIDLNYKTTSGLPLDLLWKLDGAFHRMPQWSSFYIPSICAYSDSVESSIPPSAANEQKRVGGKERQKRLLAITHDTESDNDTMPSLQSVSDSPGDTEDSILSESDAELSDYNSEEDEWWRTMLREVTEIAAETPELFDYRSAIPESLALEKRWNPLLDVVGSLRGRIFSSDPKLSSTTRTEPRKSLIGLQHTPLATTLFEQKSGAAVSGDTKNIKGNVSSESITTKKKKKTKKTKKKITNSELPAVLSSSDAVSLIQNGSPTSAAVQAPSNDCLADTANAQPGSSTPVPTISLPFKQTASKFTWFAKLGNETTKYMQQLLHESTDEKDGIKWDSFLKVMRDMGFKYELTTVGSSVRFDPPSSNDRSINLYKPHPGSTLSSSQMREYGKKLREYYGWSEKDILK